MGQRGGDGGWLSRTAAAAAALTLVLLEAEYSAALLASALLRPSCPNGGVVGVLT
jgi:hypothetical protein